MATSELRVRMYRTGFGDCFLLTFGDAADARHVLIDFGAHMQGEIGTMEPIMDDIEKETNKKLAVVVASHAHRDHISGFGKFAARFSQFKIGEVWLPWTDDPHDPDATALRKKQLALYARLDQHLRVTLGARDGDPRFAAALHALSNLRGNEPATSALANGFGVGATPRYFTGGDAVAKVDGASELSAEFLSPPKDPKFLSRMDPPADQRFLTSPHDTDDVVRPFLDLEISPKSTDYRHIVKDGQPLVQARDQRRLHELAEAPADRLALTLDNIRNNTSLVILFRYKNKALLFPGDAQWGNWQSWIGTDHAKQILGEVDFLKVAHHGSHNATPVEVVDDLRPSNLAAMVSTQVKPYPTIPRKPLLDELEKHCGGKVVVRSDWIQVSGAPAGPKPKPKFPTRFKEGQLWIDCRL
jgi:beta-lactamase superfamily II metal-dependent hydrolase